MSLFLLDLQTCTYFWNSIEFFCFVLIAYLCFCLSKLGKFCLYLLQLRGENISDYLFHLQAHTNLLEICKLLGSVLQRFKCLLGVENISKLFHDVLLCKLSGFGAVCSRSKHVCFKVSSKVYVLGLKSHLTLWLGKGEQNRTARTTLGLWEQLRSKLYPVEVTNGKGFTLNPLPPILFVLFVTVFNAFDRILNFWVLAFESPLSVILDKCVDNLNFLSQSMLQPLFRKKMCVWWAHLGWTVRLTTILVVDWSSPGRKQQPGNLPLSCLVTSSEWKHAPRIYCYLVHCDHMMSLYLKLHLPFLD